MKRRKAREWWLAKGHDGFAEKVAGRVNVKKDDVAACTKYLIRVREVLPRKPAAARRKEKD